MYKNIFRNKLAKKLVLFIIFLLCFSFLSQSTLSAAPKRNGASGCGIGSVSFPKNKKGDQIFAVLVDASVGITAGALSFAILGVEGAGLVLGGVLGVAIVRPISIATESFNCKKNLSSYLDLSRELFVALNHSQLKLEMAMGRGESLKTFASLMGCSDYLSFATISQGKSDYFFDMDVVSKPIDIVNRVKATLKEKKLCTAGSGSAIHT